MSNPDETREWQKGKTTTPRTCDVAFWEKLFFFDTNRQEIGYPCTPQNPPEKGSKGKLLATHVLVLMMLFVYRNENAFAGFSRRTCPNDWANEVLGDVGT